MACCQYILQAQNAHGGSSEAMLSAYMPKGPAYAKRPAISKIPVCSGKTPKSVEVLPSKKNQGPLCIQAVLPPRFYHVGLTRPNYWDPLLPELVKCYPIESSSHRAGAPTPPKIK